MVGFPRSKFRILAQLILLFLCFAPCFGIQNSPIFSKTLPEANEQQTLLEIQEVGRYRIKVSSEFGVSLVIVDAMAGRLGKSGKAGETDGSLDLVLDKGPYLIQLEGIPQATGNLSLEVLAFNSAGAAIRPLKKDALLPESLADLEKLQFEFSLAEPEIFRLEALGKNLEDALLWHHDGWTTGIIPTRSIYEPEPGKPMVHLEYHHSLPAGQYLLTLYGGKGLSWSVSEAGTPLFLRWDSRQWGPAGIHEITISPFGRESFLIQGETSYFEVSRREIAATHLTLNQVSTLEEPRFGRYDFSAFMNPKGNDSKISIQPGLSYEPQWIVVRGKPGDKLTLRYFPRTYGTPIQASSKPQYLGSFFGSEILKTPGVTGLLRKTVPNQEPVFLQTQLLNVGTSNGWQRQIDLQNEQDLFIRIANAGSYRIEEKSLVSATGLYQITPFQNGNYQRNKNQPFRNAGALFDLSPGIYHLVIRPNRKGLLSIGMAAADNPIPLEITNPELSFSEISWGNLNLNPNDSSNFQLWLPNLSGIPRHIIQRDWPIEISTPLPLVLQPNENRDFELSVNKPHHVLFDGDAKLQILEPGSGKVVTSLKGGHHRLTLRNPSEKRIMGTLYARPEQGPVPSRRSFEAIVLDNVHYFNLLQNQSEYFSWTVTQPGIYSLETTGLLSTSLSVQNRIKADLYEGVENGVGRNGRIQQYFKQGEYVVRVSANGVSKGRAGLLVTQSQLLQGGILKHGELAKVELSPKEAVRYTFSIDKRGKYQIGSKGLGKSFPFRIETASGWPVHTETTIGETSVELPPGAYSYLTLPLPIKSRRLTIFETATQKLTLQGKGPHVLPWQKPCHLLWRDGAPDIFTVSISAPTILNLELTPGMVAQFKSLNVEIFGGEPWEQVFSKGTYQLEVRRVESDDHYPYEIMISTKDLIPGLTQPLSTATSILPVIIGSDGLYRFHFSGPTDLRAELRHTSDNTLIAMEDDSYCDWNPQITIPLTAGTYNLTTFTIGENFGPSQVRLFQLPEWRANLASIPFRETLPTSQDVMSIPFQLNNNQLVSFDTGLGTNASLSLRDQEKVLVSTNGSLTVALKGGKTYEISAWALKKDATLYLEAKTISSRNLKLGSGVMKLGKSQAASLTSQASQTFELNDPQGILFAHTWETPLLPLESPVFSVQKGETAWIIGPLRQRSVLPLELKEEPLSMTLRESNASLRLQVMQPGLVHIETVDTFWRARLGKEDSEAIWTQMVKSPEGLIIPVAEAGTYTLNLSRFGQGNTLSRLTIQFLPFHLEQATSTPSPGETLELDPGKAKTLTLDDRFTGVLLSEFMIASARNQSVQLATWNSQAATRTLNMPSGTRQLTVYNHGTARGFVQLLAGTAPVKTLTLKLGPGQHSEAFFPSNRPVDLILTAPAGFTIHGQGENCMLQYFGDDGFYWEGSPPFKFPSISGKAHIKANDGWLSLWVSKSATPELDWLGIPGETTLLPESGFQLPSNTQNMTFQVSEPAYYRFQLDQPGIMGILQKNSLKAFAVGPQNQIGTILPPGEYALVIRPLSFCRELPKLTWDIQRMIPAKDAAQALLGSNASQVYRFQLKEKSKVGLGIQSSTDQLRGQLLSFDGKELAQGPLIIKSLNPGTYAFVVFNPSTPAVFKPLFFGLEGSHSEIPQEILNSYLDAQAH